jgi:hypothetical protein
MSGADLSWRQRLNPSSLGTSISVTTISGKQLASPSERGNAVRGKLNGIARLFEKILLDDQN